LTEPLRARLRSVDVLRGLAIAGVVLFHIGWNLDFSGLLPGNLSRHPAWLLFGRSLAGTFMVLVGVSLALAHGSLIRWRPFFDRLWVIVAAAVAISAVTRLIFPEAFIYFGILHAIAAASLIGVFFVPLSALIGFGAGAAMLTLPFLFSDPLFDTRWLAWIGFAETPPVSNDYVPLFPWAGLTLMGLGLAKAGIARGYDTWLVRHEPAGPTVMALGWLGRHSLMIYLLHQPILLALILPTAWLMK
jgi:uncharacterized membrane protein